MAIGRGTRRCAVAGDRDESASEVVNEGLRLVAGAKPSCKGSNDLAVAIEAGGEVSEIELDVDIAELAVELEAKGIAP